MALIPCPECQKEISEKAETCPNCGVKIAGTEEAELAAKNKKAEDHMGTGCLLILIAIGVIWFLWPSGDSSNNRPKQPEVTVIDDAFRVCDSFKRTGLVSDCEVRGWGSRIDVTIDTTGPEAIKMCEESAQIIAQASHRFADARAKGAPWTLRIFSPFSGDSPLATCEL